MLQFLSFSGASLTLSLEEYFFVSPFCYLFVLVSVCWVDLLTPKLVTRVSDAGVLWVSGAQSSKPLSQVLQK